MIWYGMVVSVSVSIRRVVKVKPHLRNSEALACKIF